MLPHLPTESIQHLLKIIEDVREHFPSIIIGLNRGFQIIPYVHEEINFVLYEDFGTYYDFSESSYEYLNTSRLSNLKSKVDYLKSPGLKVLGIGYLPEPHDQMYYYDLNLGAKLQTPLYLSDLMLSSTWPEWG